MKIQFTDDDRALLAAVDSDLSDDRHMVECDAESILVTLRSLRDARARIATLEADREAAVRRALEAAANESKKRGARNQSCEPGCKCADAYHIADSIERISRDPAAVAKIARDE